jgi:hypothetical protein
MLQKRRDPTKMPDDEYWLALDVSHVAARIKELHPDGAVVKTGVLYPDLDLILGWGEFWQRRFHRLQERLGVFEEDLGQMQRGTGEEPNGGRTP